VSSNLREQIELELAQLAALMSRHPDLLLKGPSDLLTNVEIDALAALLHSFYSGVENMFKRISVSVDGGVPTGMMWHVRLLDSMASSTANRTAVISERLRVSLRDYLDFRHVFRHAYSFDLQWTKMAPLVRACRTMLKELKSEISLFIDRFESHS
jgi:hypothetical protein